MSEFPRYTLHLFALLIIFILARLPSELLKMDLRILIVKMKVKMETMKAVLSLLKTVEAIVKMKVVMTANLQAQLVLSFTFT